MSVTYTAESLEDIANEFEKKADEAWNRGRKFSERSHTSVRAVAEWHTWSEAARILRATVLVKPRTSGEGPMHVAKDATEN